MKKRAAVLAALVSRPHTYMELCNAAAMTHGTVAAWVRELRNAKLVYISRWERDSRGYPTIPVFDWGPGLLDAKRPSIPSVERTRACRQRAAAKAVANAK